MGVTGRRAEPNPALKARALQIGSFIYFRNEIVNHFPIPQFLFSKMEVTESLTPEMRRGNKHFIILTDSNAI